MPRELEGDLTEAVFWGADMRGARFRDVNLTGARISHALVVDVDIDAFVDRLVVNEVVAMTRPLGGNPLSPLLTVLAVPAGTSGPGVPLGA